jgi:hypothetical protein
MENGKKKKPPAVMTHDRTTRILGLDGGHFGTTRIRTGLDLALRLTMRCRALMSARSHHGVPKAGPRGSPSHHPGLSTGLHDYHEIPGPRRAPRPTTRVQASTDSPSHPRPRRPTTRVPSLDGPSRESPKPRRALRPTTFPPFPVSRFVQISGANAFWTEHSSPSLSTSEAGEDKIHLSGPIVEHRKDEHNMENGKNAKANMWSRRCHEGTGSRSYHEDPGP